MSIASLALLLRLQAFAAAALTLLAVGGAAAQEGRSCTLSRLSGSATLLRDATLAPAQAGDLLADRDRLRTGATAKAEVTCSDGTTVTLGAATELDLGRLSGGGGGGTLVGLLEGIARFVLPEARRPGDFEVSAPTAVASVRSTEWLMQVAEGGTAVLVMRGRVGVRGRVPGPVRELTPGEGVDVAAGAPVPAPRVWGPDRAAAALRAVSF